MLHFFSVHGGTLLTALVLTAVVAAVVVHLVRTRKRGGSSCSCGCGQCHGNCHHSTNG